MTQSGGTVRLGVLGSGPVAGLHARAFAAVPGVTLEAAASRTLSNAQAFAAEHGFARATTFDDLLARPDVDALVVVVPAAAMADVVTRAAATGLPMLAEKPVGLSLDETTRVAGAVTAPNMVGLNRRFYEVIGEGRALLEAAGGVRFVEVHMPEDVRPLAERYDAHVLDTWHFGNSIHLVDLFRVFGGEPAAVTTHNTVRSTADRAYLGTIDFAGGARGVYNAQWYAPGPWRVTAYADDLFVQFAPIEEALVIRAPGRQRSAITASGPDTTFKPGFFGQAQAFAALVRTGTPDPRASDLADYVHSVALMDRLAR